MRISHRPFALLPLLAGLSGALAPAAAQGFTLGESVDLHGRFAARLTSGYPLMVATGDTLRVRSVLINLSDTALAVRASPCEIRFGGSLSIAPVEDERHCRTDPVRVAPGDSLSTVRTFTVTSPPGEYQAELSNGAFVIGARAPFGVTKSGNIVTVVDPAARPAAAPAIGRYTPPVRLPFVFSLAGGTSVGGTERELEGIVGDALSIPGGGVLALPLHPATPALGRLAHVRVSLGPAEEGGIALTLAMAHPRLGSCHSSTANYSSHRTIPPVVLGAWIALKARNYVSSVRSAQCFPGNEPF